MFFKITTKFSNIDLTDKRLIIYIMQQFVKYIELKEDEISENEISSIY